MNPAQLWVSVAVMPTLTILAVLFGIYWNNVRLSDLRSEMSARFGELSTRLGEQHSMLSSRIDDLRADFNSRLTEIGGSGHGCVGQVGVWASAPSNGDAVPLDCASHRRNGR